MDQTPIPCIGSQILNHWATREFLCVLFFKPSVHLTYLRKVIKNVFSGDFPGGPVVKTPPFHCRGYEFSWGTKISMPGTRSHTHTQTQKSERKEKEEEWVRVDEKRRSSISITAAF